METNPQEQNKVFTVDEIIEAHAKAQVNHEKLEQSKAKKEKAVKEQTTIKK